MYEKIDCVDFSFKQWRRVWFHSLSFEQKKNANQSTLFVFGAMARTYLKTIQSEVDRGKKIGRLA